MKHAIEYVVMVGTETVVAFGTIKEATAKVKALLPSLPVGAQVSIVKHFSGEKVLRTYKVEPSVALTQVA